MRLAGLQEAAAQVTDPIDPAGGIALRFDRGHDYFFLPFALLFALAAPFDFALDDFSAAHSSP